MSLFTCVKKHPRILKKTHKKQGFQLQRTSRLMIFPSAQPNSSTKTTPTTNPLAKIYDQ